MNVFSCMCEAQPPLFFENAACNVCHRLVGIAPDFHGVYAFDPAGDAGLYSQQTLPGLFKPCQNYTQHQACTGMIAVDNNAKTPPPNLCFGCQFNNTIPDLSIPAHLPLWRAMEIAKRRAFFTLSALPIGLGAQQDTAPLSFDFISDRTHHDHFRYRKSGEDAVTTGHSNGEITINLAEADKVARESAKHDMGERYRTLLGHFRHELGHYFFPQLVPNQSQEYQDFLQIFGDDTQSYQAALDRHYEQGPPPNWQTQYISAYATMHPWEDWAETWAHYLHMIDTLETAQAFQLTYIDRADRSIQQQLSALKLPQYTSHISQQSPISEILKIWMSLSVALNSFNRSMGLEDAYPFVLNKSVRQKIEFVHRVIFKN